MKFLYGLNVGISTTILLVLIMGLQSDAHIVINHYDLKQHSCIYFTIIIIFIGNIFYNTWQGIK